MNAVVEQQQVTVRQEHQLTAANIRAQVNLVQEVMKAVMKEGTHFGTIPGTPKPSLWKPGAEVLAATFRIAVSYRIEDLSTSDIVRYRVTAVGVHQTTGIVMGEGMGECSSGEAKYKWRKATNRKEFDATTEDRRRVQYGYNKNERKEFEILQVRTEAADLANTVLKMACKRAQVAMTLNVTAASDIFTQDIEDLPEELRPEEHEDGHQGQQVPKHYPSPDFEKNKAGWVKKIMDGSITLEKLQAMVKSKGELTAEQVQELKSAMKTDPNGDEPANATVLAALRKHAEEAGITDQEIAKHLGVESLDGITLVQVEKAQAFLKNPMEAA